MRASTPHQTSATRPQALGAINMLPVSDSVINSVFYSQGCQRRYLLSTALHMNAVGTVVRPTY